MEPLPEIRDRISVLEDRLERARLRRSGYPAGFLLAAVLAFLFLGEEIRGISFGEPAFFWTLLFWSGSLLGLLLNETSARRSIKALRRDLDLLRRSPSSDALSPDPNDQ